MSKLGTHIRTLRMQQRLTLQELAEACELTRSMLSKLENGRAQPSIAAVTRIASALGVQVSVLLAEGEGLQTVIMSATATAAAWKKTEKGYRYAALAAGRMKKIMQPLLFVAQRGKLKPGLLHHGGEEFIYVLEGRMRYTVGRLKRDLGPGDSLYFNAAEPHDLDPITATVKYLAVMADYAPAAEPPPARKKSPRKQ
ncbi:XRE family transcriptional regulator [soil metagenome]